MIHFKRFVLSLKYTSSLVQANGNLRGYEMDEVKPPNHTTVIIPWKCLQCAELSRHVAR